jgi:hypothetical protein
MLGGEKLSGTAHAEALLRTRRGRAGDRAGDGAVKRT